jgi:acylphosphatase
MSKLSRFKISFSLHFNCIPRIFSTIMQVRAHVLVNGLVQGVGFRYFVMDRAVNFGLVGFARNLLSGDVEIEVEGDRSIIEEFIKEVRVGPRAARVSGLKIEWLKCSGLNHNFEVL